MKKVTKFFMAAFLAGMCSVGYAQTKYEWEKPAKPTETEIGVISCRINSGSWKMYDSGRIYDNTVNYSIEHLYEELIKTAKDKYGETYPQFALRNFKGVYKLIDNDCSSYTGYNSYYDLSASVVIQDIKKLISTAMNKALRDVPEGSRIAFDRVTSSNEEIDRDDLKDKVTDILLDKGYRIVAKEYFAKLYEEQQAQQSGIYNDKTTVQENNFSAVGYYINVKVTETSLRVQVVNVSTGEYEGNATVNF